MKPQQNFDQAGFLRAGTTLSERLPLVVFPQHAALLGEASTKAIRACAERYLTNLGCILFRGFEVHGAAQLTRFAAGFGRGVSPSVLQRVEVQPDASLGASAPWSFALPSFGLAHVRSVSADTPPIYWVCCERAPPSRAPMGSVIADNRAVYRRLPIAVRTRFLGRDLLYVRSFAATGEHTWQRAFGSDERACVEAWCERHRTRCEWQSDGGLRLLRVRPALAQHPITGASLWLNQLHRWPSSSALSASSCSSKDGPLAVYYANGTLIEQAIVDEVQSAFEASARIIQWERGDVLMLDSLSVWHAHVPAFE